MDSPQIVDYLLALTETNSVVTKRAILKRALEEDDQKIFERMLVYALDPRYVFGVAQLPVVPAMGAEDFGEEDFKLLDRLRRRELTGNAARSAIEARMRQLDAYGANILARVLLKDLRCGVGAATVNKVRPGLIFEFSCMLAAQFDPSKVSYPVHVEPKFDGMRVIAISNAGGFNYFTRSGKTVDTIPAHITEELLALFGKIRECWGYSYPAEEIMFDGELMGESFRETMKKARRKGATFEDARYYVFDVLPCSHFEALDTGPSMLTYHARRSLLEKAFEAVGNTKGIVLPPSYVVNSEAEVMQYYESMRARGLEGLIVKARNGLYRGARHSDWMKLKECETLDLPVVGCEEGTGKYAGSLGALIVNHNGVLVNVGTGFTDEDRVEIWELWCSPSRGEFLRRVAEIGFQEITPDGSLRHPRFIRWRDDKKVSDAA